MTKARSDTPVKDAFQTYLESLASLSRAQRNGGRDPDTGQTADEAAKSYYESMGVSLRAFNAPENWRRDGSAKEPLPRQLAFDVGQIFDDLLAGLLRPSIAHLFFSRGRPGLGAIQRRAVETAVRYVAAVQGGLIVDSNPIERVAKLFEVNRRTVRRWMADHRMAAISMMPSNRAGDPDGMKDMLVGHLKEAATFYKERRHVKVRQ